MQTQELVNITKAILASNGVEEELRCAHILSDFLSQFSLDETGPNKARKHIESVVSGGVALSPLGAAVCVDDYLRTMRFIKASYHAINELQTRFPGQRINILYAGSGPYATILTPILPFFNEHEIGVTLLDINSYSLQAVESLLSSLELYNRIDATICDDAVTYKHASELPLHMVISETMFYALTREPQVAITLNLAPQIVENGILMPEQISIDLKQAFFAKELFWDLTDKNPEAKLEAYKPYEHEPIAIGNVFRIGKDHLFSETVKTSGRFESEWFQTPSDFTVRPDICLFTTVSLFGDIAINSSQSSITNPFCIQSIYNLKQGSSFRLIYNFEQIPSWTIEVKE